MAEHTELEQKYAQHIVDLWVIIGSLIEVVERISSVPSEIQVQIWEAQRSYRTLG